MVAAAIIGGVAGLGGAAIASHGAQKGAQLQTQAGQQAIDAQTGMFSTVRNDLMPYQQLGQTGINQLTGQLPYLTSSFAPTQEWLESTPGYQFNKAQGLKAVQNTASARGLGISGAAQKGAANFATALADSTWQNQFNADQTQKTNIYNKLMGVVQSGQNAAAQTGNYGTQTAQSVGQTYQGIGNAQAGGAVGSSNALAGGISGLGQIPLLAGIYGNSGSGGGSNASASGGGVTWRI